MDDDLPQAERRRPETPTFCPCDGDAAEVLLGQPIRYDLSEVARRAGVSPELAARYWHALGFSLISYSTPSFTDADVQALERAAELVRTGRVDETHSLSMTRALARSADRLAVWQASLILEDALGDHGVHDTTAAELTDLSETRTLGAEAAAATRVAAERLVAAADRLEPLVSYAWRRHLAATLNRLLTHGRDGEDVGRHTVGFADMVGYTSLARELTDGQLGSLITSFEDHVTDVVAAHGGRVVKTIGDEIFFVPPGEKEGLDIALYLLDVLARDPSLPTVRIGIATGHVLVHLGDLFGTTVNRASRICEFARPGTVLVDDSTADVLRRDDTYLLTPHGAEHLRGLGATPMWGVTRL